jgi:hypothetical protein
MVYGLVSPLDDATTKAVFKSKRIPAENIVSNSQLGRLVEVLKSGDVVYAISVNRFGSVAQLFTFIQICWSKGVTVHFITETYLDVGNGKQWRTSVGNLVGYMGKLDSNIRMQMAQNIQLTNEQWRCVYQYLQIMNLETLSHIFATDGILKRGS